MYEVEPRVVDVCAFLYVVSPNNHIMRHGEYYPTLSNVFPVITALLKKHLLPNETESKNVKGAKDTISNEIETRFYVSEQILLLVVGALNPQMRCKAYDAIQAETVKCFLLNLMGVQDIDTQEKSPGP